MIAFVFIVAGATGAVALAGYPGLWCWIFGVCTVVLTNACER